MKIQTISIILLLVFFSFIYLYHVNQYNYPGWDPAVYMLNAKDWLNTNQTYLFENFRSPLLSWLIAGVWKFTGIDFNYIKWLSCVFTIFSAIVLYLIVKNTKNALFAFIITLLFLINPSVFQYTTDLYTESLSLFFLLLIIYFMGNDKFILSGIFIGLAFASRYFMVLQAFAIFGAIILIELQNNQDLKNDIIKNAFKTGIVAIIVMLFIVLIMYLKTGMVQFALKGDSNWIFLKTGEWYLLNAIPIFGIIIIFLPFCIFCIDYTSSDFIFFLWFIVGIFFWTGNAKHNPRYLIQIIPAAYYLALLPINYIYEKIKNETINSDSSI